MKKYIGLCAKEYENCEKLKSLGIYLQNWITSVKKQQVLGLILHKLWKLVKKRMKKLGPLGKNSKEKTVKREKMRILSKAIGILVNLWTL